MNENFHDSLAKFLLDIISSDQCFKKSYVKSASIYPPRKKILIPPFFPKKKPYVIHEWPLKYSPILR